MKLRQARKIMKNVCMHPAMHWVYGSGRVDKANVICIHHYARVNPVIKKWNIFKKKQSFFCNRLVNKT